MFLSPYCHEIFLFLRNHGQIRWDPLKTNKNKKILGLFSPDPVKNHEATNVPNKHSMLGQHSDLYNIGHWPTSARQRNAI